MPRRHPNGAVQEDPVTPIRRAPAVGLNGGRIMNTVSERSRSTRRLVITAFFIAFVLLFGLTPVGLIPLGFINLTILHLPVIIGAILMGWKTGLILGFCFGTVSMLSMLGFSGASQSVLAHNLFVASPPLAILMCYIPRLLVPCSARGVWCLFRRKKELRLPGLMLAGIAGSLTNTIFYLGLMYLFYRAAGMDLAELAQGLGLGGLGFFGILGAIAAGGGGMEAVAAALITPPVVRAVQAYTKQEV